MPGMSHNSLIIDLLRDLWITSGIFSNHYLLERLPQAGSTVWPSDEEVLPIYKAIRELYEKNIVGLRKGNEANTERRFIDKVFNKLGFGYLNQDKIPEAERRQVPDYFLYSTPNEADKAFELRSHEKYRLAISIAEAKRWDHNLDQPSSGKGKAPKGRYPHLQIRDYLNESEHIRWGILTNGKEWRLYFGEGRSSKFFEIDLEECLKDLLRFKYFFPLFRPDAFIKDSSGKCLLDHIFEQSLRFQEDVEKDLREKVFKCVEWLGQGFLFREENQLTEKDLDSVYHYSLILLYRILFVLNAEARDLLPTNPQTKYYKHYGIQRIKDRIRQEKGEFISAKAILYDDLLALFHLINGDNEKLNREMKIPRYNGGLFDPERYSFLEQKKVGDDVLSEVIYELSFRTNKDGENHSIDYKGLGERHLGTVYEGLLEHKFTFDNGKVILKNDKGERKATGAYYTPDYIVKYIVENTLGPILKEIDEKITISIPSLLKGGRGDYKDNSFATEVLKLNICDPAMGSGHFLVEAVQYLADEIAYHPTTQLKTLKGEAEDEVNYWKRRVVESCIYGVDIKELAVELAKLSLWLKTVDRSQPLNFLDHHLRCGNSLIGARISDLNYLPHPKGKKKSDMSDEQQLVLFDISRFKEDITAIVKGFQSIEEMPSEKLSDIKAKEKTFKNLMEELNRYREIADLWTSLFFGNSLEEKEQIFEELLKDQYRFQLDIFGSDAEITEKKKVKTGISNQMYTFIVNMLQSPDGKSQIPKLSSLLKNSETIAGERKFFHWELEFPEVFFNEDGSPKENPGFDCVIGNPPYINAIELNKLLSEYEKPFWKEKFKSASGAYDLYLIFYELGLSLVKSNNCVSLITPNKFLSAPYAVAFRELISSNHQFTNIMNCSRIKIFEDPAVYPVVATFRKGSDAEEYAITVITPSEANKDETKTMKHSSKDLNTLPDNIWGFLLSSQLDLVLKITKFSDQLSEVANVQATSSTAEADEFENALIDGQATKKYWKFINTGLIDRYASLWGIEPLFHKGKYYLEPCLDISNSIVSPMRVEMYKKPKIIFAKMALHIEGFVDLKGEYSSANTNCVFNSKYDICFLGAILNSSLMNFIYKEYFGALIMSGGYFQYQAPQLKTLPIPRVSFTTSEKERRERVGEAIGLYKKYMLELSQKGKSYEKAESSEEPDRPVADGTYDRGKEKAVSGKHPVTGKRVHGVRGRTRKPEDVERISEDSEEYRPSTRYTRYIESSLGIKSYSELAPHLAKGVERVMASLLEQSPEELKITPEFICSLHKDAFGELFPSWAGRYRDRDVTVGAYNPPPYYEAPVLTRQYCDDVEFRLSSLGSRPTITEVLLETLAFAEGRLLSIHPFPDFNGRVTRMLLFALLYRLDLPPVPLVPDEKNPDEKEAYLKALSEADHMNWQPLVEIWQKRFGMGETK